MMRALILTGRRRYANQWHPLNNTWQRITGLLSESGISSELSGITAEDRPSASNTSSSTTAVPL